MGKRSNEEKNEPTLTQFHPPPQAFGKFGKVDNKSRQVLSRHKTHRDSLRKEKAAGHPVAVASSGLWVALTRVHTVSLRNPGEEYSQ